MISTWARAVGLAVVLPLCVGACRMGPPSERRLKGLIEEAAMASSRDLAALVETDDWSSVENQNLTLTFAWTAPIDVPCANLESLPESTEPPSIEILTTPWDRGEVLECLLEDADRGRFFDRLWQRLEGGAVEPPGTASLLWKQTITEVDFQVNDEMIAGTVHFEKPECFRGRLPFEGHRTDQGWVISAFTLPGADWRVDRDNVGRWQALRLNDNQLFPDLEILPANLVSDVHILADTALRLKHNGVEIDLAALPGEVAGRLVVLRPDIECRFSDVLETLTALKTADPPVRGVFWITRRMIAGRWLMLGLTETSRSPFAHSEAWIGTLERVERSRMPPDALQLCVDRDGYRFSNGTSLPILLGSARDVVAFGADEMKNRPDAVFLLAIDSDMPYEKADEALDAVWATKAQRVFVYTDKHHGFVLEAHDPPPPPSVIAARRAAGAKAGWPTPPLPPPPVLSSPPDPGPHRFVTGGKITEPERLEGIDPTYPEAAESARIQGVVVLELLIGTDGAVEINKVLRGLPMGLTEAATNAVSKWRYRPATVSGHPVEVLYIETVRFTVPSREP